MTVTAWIKTTPASGSAGIVSKYLSGAFCGWQIFLSDGNVQAWYFADATNNVWNIPNGINGGPVADGTWHHVAFTVDDSGGSLYVDAVLKATHPWSGTPMRTTGIQPLKLGSYAGAGSAFYSGYLDEVTIWNVRLTQTQVADLMHQSLRGDEAGLAAYFRLDEGSGEIIYDSATGNTNNGMIQGTNPVWVASTAPVDSLGATNGLPSIVKNPTGEVVPAGSNVLFFGTDTIPMPEHQWLLNGKAIPGATSLDYVIPFLTPTDAGSYQVESKDANVTLTSPASQLEVLTTPKILVQPVGEIVDIGGSVALTPTIIGGTPMNLNWFHNGVSMPGETTQFLSIGRFSPYDVGEYYLVASNRFGAVTTWTAKLQQPSNSIVSKLVVHLPFDNSLHDVSGRSNNATYLYSGAGAKTSPTFVAGQIGQSFQFTTLKDGSRFEYASLGYPTDLQLGDTDDFTVSFWINYTSQTDDLPFISNKDWDKSHYQGWTISTQDGGNFRLNATGPHEGAEDFTTATTPIIRDGLWHHLVCSFQRAESGQSAWVYSYVDGRLVNKTAMQTTGSIDSIGHPFIYASPRKSTQTSWALNIGQDGTGVYFDKGGASAIGAKIDDLGIWRRALSANEAQAIFAAGLTGKDLSKSVPTIQLYVSRRDGKTILFWPNQPNLGLETTKSLASTVWSPVPHPLGANTLEIDSSDETAFFRLVQTP